MNMLRDAKANQAHALDAVVALRLQSEDHLRRASDARCYDNTSIWPRQWT